MVVLPAILSGNSLLGGTVVYFDGDGWSPSLASALVASDEPGRRALERAVEEARRTAVVLDVQIVPVGTGPDGEVVPLHYRHRIRALGPTVRPDLGPSGQGKHGHVSL